MDRTSRIQLMLLVIITLITTLTVLALVGPVSALLIACIGLGPMAIVFGRAKTDELRARASR